MKKFFKRVKRFSKKVTKKVKKMFRGKKTGGTG